MGRKTRGVGIIPYGDPGIGKSGLAAQFPKPILGISCKETGYADLIDAGEIEETDLDEEDVDSWTDLLNLLKHATGYSTIVIDSLSGVAQFMQQDILKKNYQNNLSEFGAFSSGWRTEGPVWAEKLVDQLTLLRSKGVNVILIGHKRSETEKDPLKNDYQKTVLDIEKWPRAVFTKWAQATLFLTMDFTVKTSKMWKKKATEHKVEEDLDDKVERVMYTASHPVYDAKNRLKLPNPISMGDSAQEAYHNLISNFPPRIQQHLQFTPSTKEEQ